MATAALVLAACCLVAAAGVAAAAPPTLENATRGNATAIVVTVTDDDDVEERSIEAADFDVEGARVDSIAVEERGSDARVRLVLDSPLDRDRATVELVGDVDDEGGERTRSGSVVATGMDAVPPGLDRFGAERVDGGDVRFVVEATEPLGAIRLAASGPAVANLNRSAFRAAGDGRYVAVRRFPDQGEYGATLIRIADEHGNERQYNAEAPFVIDREPPRVDATGPATAAAGRRYGFAADATDNVGIERYRWTFPNGTATGRAVTHAFRSAGTHNVTLRVRDAGGNVAVRNHTVTVRPGADPDGVSVEPNGPDRIEATVRNASRSPALVARGSGPLAAAGNLSLASLSVGIDGTGPAAVAASAGRTVPPSFAEAADRPALGSFVLTANRSVAEAAVEFAVERERLRAVGLDPGNVSLYRADEGWSELDTRRIRADDGRIVYEATTPGFSTFVVAGSGAGGRVVVRSATLLTSRVRPDGYAVVDATVTNEGVGAATRRLALTVDGTSVDRRSVRLGRNETRTVRLAAAVSEGGRVGVGSATAGNLSVGAPAPTSETGTPSPTASPTPAGASTPETGTRTETATPAPTPVENGSTATAAGTGTATPSPTPTPRTATGDGTATAGRNATGTNATGTATAESALPGPLAALLGGLPGTLLAGGFWFVVFSFASLKAVALRLGY